jgi:uncharacterized protein YndB with AHSA1/START domain
MAEILHTLPIAGKPSKVYNAITEQNGLRSWWTRFTMAESTIGYVNEFGFGGAFKFEMRVDELEKDEFVQWTCLAGHEEWVNTQIQFRLEPIEDKKHTLLHFSQTGWLRTNGVLPQCSYDWAQYLRSLKMYIEQGKGTPS